MAGYDGYSMSNNAKEAYSNGEMPLSKWNKTLLIDGIMTSISENGFEYSDIDVDDIYKKIKKINCKKLKSVFLRYSSWHHTSCHYNETDFYSVDDTMVEKISAKWLEELILSSKEEQNNKKEELKSEKWECIFLVWGGTRKHPKATEVKAIGEIKGNWFYLADGSKKSIHANGFKKIRQIEE